MVYNKNYYQEHKKVMKAIVKRWKKKNPEKVRASQKRYRKKHKKEISERGQKYYIKNKLMLNKKNEEYRKTHKEEKREYDKNYQIDNRKDISKKAKKFKKEKYKNDKNFKMKLKLQSRLMEMFKHYIKTGKIRTSKKEGIDYRKVIKYLKPLPKDYLTSKNKHHIHHIKPLSTFNFISKNGTINLKEIKKAFAPENHVLLTIKEHKEIHRNLRKVVKSGLNGQKGLSLQETKELKNTPQVRRV